MLGRGQQDATLGAGAANNWVGMLPPEWTVPNRTRDVRSCSNGGKYPHARVGGVNNCGAAVCSMIRAKDHGLSCVVMAVLANRYGNAQCIGCHAAEANDRYDAEESLVRCHCSALSNPFGILALPL